MIDWSEAVEVGGVFKHTCTNSNFCIVSFFGCVDPLAAAMFMEHWKRRQMRLNYEWDLTGFEDEEVRKFSSAALPQLILFQYKELKNKL